jgi:hypothetical protein
MRLFATLFCACALLHPLATATRAGSQNPPPPVSAATVELRILIDDSMSATVRVRNGERATVSADGKGTLAIIPTATESLLDLCLVKLSVDDAGRETAFEVGRYSLERGVAQILHAAGFCLEIEWSNIIAPGSAQRQQPNAPCSQCCVVCDGRQVCGCAVETACGRCCCPEACDCSTGSMQAESTSSVRACSTKTARRPDAGLTSWSPLATGVGRLSPR